MILRLLRLLLVLGGLTESIKVGAKTKLKRGRLCIGPKDRIYIGTQSLVEAKVISDRSPARLNVGDRTFIGRSLIIIASEINIGNDVLISWGVTIVDHDSHSPEFNLRKHDVTNWGGAVKDWTNVRISPVTICNKAWVGFGASILRGVTIGEGAIVAAQSVVTQDVLPWTMVAGNPARLKKILVRPATQ